jgi:hypothetical protein
MAEKSLSLDELVRKLMGDEHADVLRETLALSPCSVTAHVPLTGRVSQGVVRCSSLRIPGKGAT